MNSDRSLVRLGLAALLGACMLDCASTQSESQSESSRPAEIAGLAPIPRPPAESQVEPPPESRRLPTATGGLGSSNPGLKKDEAAASPRPGARMCEARLGLRVVKRAALERTLDAGLGTWLRGVDVEAKIDRGRFRGWLVRSIYAGDPCWAEIDLRTGDIVTRVNRRRIERPEEAQAVWTGLRTTSEVVVDYLRDGQPRTLRFTVVDAPE